MARKQILLLHGSRQTGQLLLGRIDKLRRRLRKDGYDVIAIDAPWAHPDDSNLRQWWTLVQDDSLGSCAYEGLDQSLSDISNVWSKGSFVGLLGFSQGARLVHLLLVAHHCSPETVVPGVRFGILVSGYDASMPTNWPDFDKVDFSCITKISTPSLHVWGVQDQLIPPDRSRALSNYYRAAQVMEHDGGHHIPIRSDHVAAYLNFINDVCHQKLDKAVIATTVDPSTGSLPPTTDKGVVVPDDETALLQRDEVEALQAIFLTEEFNLLSQSSHDGELQFPIRFRVAITRSTVGWWPPHDVAIEFEYPSSYPGTAMPRMKLVHENNMLQFSSAQVEACLASLRIACEQEAGNPCVLSCVYAAREFFESGALIDGLPPLPQPEANLVGSALGQPIDDERDLATSSSSTIKSCSLERIQACIDEGLEIAAKLISKTSSLSGETNLCAKGGSFSLTIGLVGKPSAGKSTFFNVATAFARQRGDAISSIGGATMAPHPFTTINPNVGFCLAPAPIGSCPEEEYIGGGELIRIGCTHGRDSDGRRLIPVLIKDVAGLVPGAYQGRGRGNKFLNDLCDADVLIHILDASGMADEGGNVVGTDSDGSPCDGGSHPMHDLAWIRKELIEWVFTNLMQKWAVIRRKGRSKLADMFSGYGQPEAVTARILNAIEEFLEVELKRDRPLDNLVDWDKGDVHRLVSTFLAIRFPMVLALNKKDLPTSAKYIAEIQAALPLFGAHTAIPMCAKSEMIFVRSNIQMGLGLPMDCDHSSCHLKSPQAVWKCLQDAVALAEPVIVFPVSDFTTLAPMPGLSRVATEDPSLPSHGMIRCLESAGGQCPSHWDSTLKTYLPSMKLAPFALRDALTMKPHSNVEDVFLTLKRLGAVGGEFVRAEATGSIGQPPKPVPKHEKLSKSIRIIKIMTSRRSAWQK